MAGHNKNPWLGLQAYREGEILYGRDEEIRSLSQCVLSDTDTVLYGRSGIGKSSIINAGVIPVARRRGVVPLSIRLDHQDGKNSYIRQIRSALAQEGIEIRNIVAPRGKEELFWELFHGNEFRNHDGERVSLLVIFDQFEEIFTLQQDQAAKRRFFEEMADVLNDIRPACVDDSPELPANETATSPVEMTAISPETFDFNLENLDFGLKEETDRYVRDNELHFVFTLREDFLSEFEYYTAAIPSLKQHRYGLRPINEEQAAEIIMKPQPGLISRDVARLIIEKVTGRSDFLLDGKPEIEVDAAVLSLYLSRLYEQRRDEIVTASLVEEKGGEIISDFYESSIADVPASVVETLEDELLNEDGRRENKSYSILCGRLGRKNIDKLTSRQLLRRFAYAGDQRVEFIHDILCPVIRQRKEQREHLRQQKAERERQEAEKRALLAKEEQKRREIEAKALTEKKRAEREIWKTRRRNRNRLLFFSSLFLFLLTGFGFYIWLYEFEHVAYYASFERINGWPVGIGEELSAEAREKTPLYYKLSHKGHLDHETDVEIMSSNPQLPLTPRISVLEVDENDTNDKAAHDFYEKLSAIRRIHFVEGENGVIDKEIAIGENDSTLYMISYFHLDKGKGAWAQFVKADGQALLVRDKGVDRIKLSYDDDGRVASLMYFDAAGVHQPVAQGAYGYAMKNEPALGRVSRYTLDEFGQPRQSRGTPDDDLGTRRDEWPTRGDEFPTKSHEFPTRDNDRRTKIAEREFNVKTARTSGDTVETSFAYARQLNEASPTPVAGPEGYSHILRHGTTAQLYVPGKSTPVARRTYRHDRRGNVVEERTTGLQPVPHAAIIRHTYDEKTGYPTSLEKLTAQGKPFRNSADPIYRKTWQYADNRLVGEQWFAPDSLIYEHQVRTAGNVRTEITDNRATGNYLLRRDTTVGDNIHTAFYGKNNRRTTVRDTIGQTGAPMDHHWKISHRKADIQTTTYYTLSATGDVVRCPKMLDNFGMPTSYYKKEEQFDSLDNIVSRRLYDEQGKVFKSMMYFYQNGQPVARAAMGIDGTPVRCPSWEEEGFAYYQIFYSKDFKNQYTNIKAVNEWGATSTFYDPSGEDYHYLKVEYKNFRDSCIKDGNKSVAILNDYRQHDLVEATDISRTEIPYLHLLSRESPLYKAGFRDGDRIAGLGKWRTGQPQSLLAAEWKRLASEPLTLTVARPDGLSLRVIRKTVSLTADVLAEYHVYRLTVNEATEMKKFFTQHRLF